MSDHWGILLLSDRGSLGGAEGNHREGTFGDDPAM